MTLPCRIAALLALAGLSACAVAPPAGPTVLAMPPAGKDLGRFQQEDFGCRNYAMAVIGGASPAQAANQAAIGSAAVGAGLGAAAGALLGAAGGAAGTGAAVGAGAGLLAGSAIGAGTAQASGHALQQAYDAAYAQCMAASGNQVTAGVAPLPAVPYGHAVPAWPYGYYQPYPSYHPGYYAGPSVSLGFGVYRGWGYRPWRHHPWYW
ncbi:glycine zipper family protein [Crenalkalicoccus roseus]|uniref:glycine zipper family protein n=1 Tax=Crenalkalicoccus roseus TaxID=1485588 RepID=UPI0010808684|nr:glycine zipper family protein [Crenalkalicoccus roseus]